MLFQNQFLAIIERDGYTFSREVRCNGEIVSLLPFRIDENKMMFLARLEICPAHSLQLERCSITGGIESGMSAEAAAQQELWEEAGFQADTSELISLGQVRPSKSADTIAHLFAIDVTQKSQSIPPGDGTHFEADASVMWVDYIQGIQIADPLFVTAITRLQSLKSAL